jgi:hypothetical protein
VRTLRSAAELLTAAASAEDLVPIASSILGVSAEPEPLAREAADRLGLPRALTAIRVMRGQGTLRALVAESSSGEALRDVVMRVAARLSQRSPHLLWVAVVCERGGHQVAIASWSGDRSPPRVAALIADRTRIVDSDAETLCALAAAKGGVDVLVHLRWLELLGRDALTRRFYRTLERTVDSLAIGSIGRASAEDRSSLALLCMSRLLFLAFLEAKGWLDGDRGFLARRFDECIAGGGGFDRRVLRVLFFGTLNTPPRSRAPAARALGQIPFLNGGLFSRTPTERRVRDFRFRDEELGSVFGDLLGRYRFTAREDSATWSEAAVDPEMLGKAFESLMASRDRRGTGAFFTPHAMVEQVTRAALSEALAGEGLTSGVVCEALGGNVIAPHAEMLRARAGRLRVLDPACGSGAFLVQVLEQLADLAARCGDSRPIALIRRDVLTRSIFGVDVNPTAVWLCELRLWLSVVIESDHEDPIAVPPLPNLDHNVRVGDALAGEAFAEVPAATARRGRGVAATIERLRGRYGRATGRRKETLATALDHAERTAAVEALDAELERVRHLRRDLVAALRSRDLFGGRTTATAPERTMLEALRRQARSLRGRCTALRRGASLPFTFSAHFADAAADGGFDVVIGNPPWVRLHNIPPAARVTLKQRYRVYREAAWEHGAVGAHAGSGFAGQVDLAALFVERSLALLAPGGVLGLLLPVKLWRSLAGGGVRQLLLDAARVLALEDWTGGPAAFDAAVYPSLLLARSRSEDPENISDAMRAAVRRRGRAFAWTQSRQRLALDCTPGSPWLIVPPEVRTAFDRLTTTGMTLSSSRIGRPLLGVKSGCNEAFVVEVVGETGFACARIRSGDRTGCIESSMLRPLLRGEDIAPWSVRPGTRSIVWTHGANGGPLDRLPERAEQWLAPLKRQLASRSDSRSARRWWALYRTDAAASDRDRVVWSDFGRVPRAAVLPAGSSIVPINSCYVARCETPDDAMTLMALLNSPLAAAWLSLIAEPARGAYHRYMGWTVALLPLPREWSRATEILAPLARRATTGDVPGDGELLEAVIRAYRVRLADMAPLLAWAAG